MHTYIPLNVIPDCQTDWTRCTVQSDSMMGFDRQKHRGIPQCSQESFSLWPVLVQHQDLCLQAVVASIVGHAGNNSASMVLQIRLAPLARAHNVGCDATQLCCHLPCLLWLASLQYQQAERMFCMRVMFCCCYAQGRLRACTR